MGTHVVEHGFQQPALGLERIVNRQSRDAGLACYRFQRKCGYALAAPEQRSRGVDNPCARLDRRRFAHFASIRFSFGLDSHIIRYTLRIANTEEETWKCPTWN